MARSVDFGFGRDQTSKVLGSREARELTQGTLYTVMSGGLMENPVLQILSEAWKISAGTQFERYCILVSDGQHKEVATLSSELYDKVTSGGVPLYSVVQINRFRTYGFNDVEGRERSTMVIKRLTILEYGTEVGNAIGNPVFLSERGAALDAARQQRAIARHSCLLRVEYCGSAQPEVVPAETALDAARQQRAIARLSCVLRVRHRRVAQLESVPADRQQIQNVAERPTRMRQVLLGPRRGRLTLHHILQEHGVVLLPPDVNQALEQLIAQLSVAPPA